MFLSCSVYFKFICANVSTCSELFSALNPYAIQWCVYIHCQFVIICQHGGNDEAYQAETNCKLEPKGFEYHITC